MLKLAVVGKDVSKSLSPQMHAFLLGKLGERCRYDALSISPERFAAEAGALFSAYDGFNVTIPFKREIMPFLAGISADAARFGAVNTVKSSTRFGYNTDGDGFLLMLANADVETKGKSALVLGAGGAGRSCIAKLEEAGAEVFAYERDEKRLGEVYAEIGGFTPLNEVPLRPFDLIVNCTGVGMHDTVGRVPSMRLAAGEAPATELLPMCGLAVDLIYTPARSEFLLAAERLGKRAINGEAMLFYQAYLADCIFLGRTPDPSLAKRFREEYTEANR